MLFNSLEYLIFLPAAWILFWTLRRHQVEVLLVASYVFYASWSIPYAAMIFGLVVINYLFGLALGKAIRRRRLLLAGFIAFDVAVLGVFKYLDFAMGSLVAGANLVLGSELEASPLKFVLPLGISFFTFEFIHYLIDIYRGDVPVHSFSKFHVFAAFFPTQIAGPIKRFQQFVPALASMGRFDTALAQEGLWLIGRGLVKKVLLADRLGPWANQGFGAAAGGAIGTLDAWTAVFAFSLQIFFDFSGYTDIARGSAALFGFRIPINFDAPFLATSLTDFWRRWHISLTSWLRDYVFIPLGGSRRSRLIVTRNIMITLLLGGLWHGAGWHFVVWGGVWGVGLSLHHVLRGRLTLPRTAPTLLAGWAFTQLFFVVTLVLFRSETFEAAAVMYQAMIGQGVGSGTLTVRGSLFVAATFAALVIGSYVQRRGSLPRIQVPSGRVRPILYGATAAMVILVASVAAPVGRDAFFYFQF